MASPATLPDRTGGARILSSLRSAVQPIANHLLTVALPSECRLCSSVLTRASRLPVCDACRELEAQSGPLCSICGEALDMESARFEAGYSPAEGLLCHPCRLVPPLFERAVAYTRYDGSVRELLHLLKYERMRPAVRVLTLPLALAIRELRTAAADQLVVTAVPLFPSKERARGYNQSDVLAREALRLLRAADAGWALAYEPDLLVRRRATASQFELSPRGRRRNLQGAFAVREKGFRAGSEVLLIDDIYTSGATARECANVLRRAGAAKVWVATLARAQRPQVALWDGGGSPSTAGFG